MKMSDIMTLEERVLSAQNDNAIENELIKEYKNFIASCARKTAGKYITDQDDEVSIAMLAFHEALSKYDSEKGSFLNFANIMIKNRMIDYIRKEKRNAPSIPFSELSKIDEDGNVVEFDIEAPQNDNYDIKYELESLLIELGQYDISYFDLAKVTPKSKKTKLACRLVIEYIMNSPILTYEIKQKKYLPNKLILEAVSVNQKILERHRKYIIAAVIILTGPYDMTAEYFKDMKGGTDK